MPQFSNSLDPNQDARSIEIDGKRFATGLQRPSTRPLTFSPLSSAVRPLTKQQIVGWVNDRRRTPSSKLFPADRFIKSQGNRGSCNGYAGAKALEKSRVLLGMPHVELSGEGLYAQINDGRDQGSMLDDGMNAMMKNGVPPESMVPHEEYRQERISGEAWREASKYMATECYRLDNEMDLASAVASNFMCVVAVHAGRSFMRADGSGVLGIDHGDGNHSVGVDDLRIVDGQLQYRMVNSWGIEFGVEGCGWTTFAGHYQRTIRVHAFYAIRGAKRS